MGFTKVLTQDEGNTSGKNRPRIPSPRLETVRFIEKDKQKISIITSYIPPVCYLKIFPPFMLFELQANLLREVLHTIFRLGSETLNSTVSELEMLISEINGWRFNQWPLESPKIYIRVDSIGDPVEPEFKFYAADNISILENTIPVYRRLVASGSIKVEFPHVKPN